MRIVSGSSCHTESEERTFHHLKTITTNTSNHHPDNVILNAIIRTQIKSQAEKELPRSTTKHASPPPRKNTVFTFHFIEKNKWIYQSHLEKIADFLVEGTNWIETENGIEFYDYHFHNLPKKPHHFRSYSISEEINYVNNCWKKCLEKANETIPAISIKVEENNCTKVIQLNTLQYTGMRHIGEITPINADSKLKDIQVGNNKNAFEETSKEKVSTFLVQTMLNNYKYFIYCIFEQNW